MTADEMTELADQIERSEGLVRIVPGEGAVQLGIKRTAAIIAMLRDRRKYSLLESQFANCHKEIKSLRGALIAIGHSDKAS